MSYRIARLQHSILLAVAAGEAFDPLALTNLNAGVAVCLEGNRDATDTELLALENLSDQVLTEHQTASEAGGESVAPTEPSTTPASDPTSGGGDAAATASESGDEGTSAPPSDPTSGNPVVSVPSAPPETVAPVEADTNSVVNASEAGGAETPQEAQSVTAVTAPDAGVAPAPAETSPSDVVSDPATPAPIETNTFNQDTTAPEPLELTDVHPDPLGTANEPAVPADEDDAA